jgi:hypothetical protein
MFTDPNPDATYVDLVGGGIHELRTLYMVWCVYGNPVARSEAYLTAREIAGSPDYPSD